MRKKEFLKKSEARIIIYLNGCANFAKSGSRISETLKMDYIYLMKLLREMYNRGWLKSHQYQQRSYYEITEHAPVEKAKEILTDTQIKLNVKVGNQDDLREIEKSCMEIKGFKGSR